MSCLVYFLFRSFAPLSRSTPFLIVLAPSVVQGTHSVVHSYCTFIYLPIYSYPPTFSTHSFSIFSCRQRFDTQRSSTICSLSCCSSSYLISSRVMRYRTSLGTAFGPFVCCWLVVFHFAPFNTLSFPPTIHIESRVHHPICSYQLACYFTIALLIAILFPRLFTTLFCSTYRSIILPYRY